MSFQLSRNFKPEENLLIFKPIGELDIYSSTDFKRIGEKEYQKYKTDIVIDGKELTYLDSTGLGAFIYLLNLVQKNGHKIKFKQLSSNIKKLFTITQMEDLFEFEGDQYA